jgi:hypothetical protein
VIKNPEEQFTALGYSTAQVAKHKRSPRRDPSYRPTESAKADKQPIHRQSLRSAGLQAERHDVKPSGNSTKGEPAGEQGEQKCILSAASATSSQTEAPDTPVPSTPIQDMALFTSPQTEEIPRGKIPTSLKSNSSPTRSISTSSIEIATTRELILEAITIIYSFSKHQYGVPAEVHKCILQTLKISQDDAFPIWTQWSNGSMWTNILRAGHSESKRVSILNMLEDMGASAWYDDQITLAQESIRTKKNKPVDRKGAAIYVLNRIQGEDTISNPGKCIKSTTTLFEEPCTGIVKEIDREERRRIAMQLSRGKKLRTKLVKKLSLGILFSSKIW